MKAPEVCAVCAVCGEAGSVAPYRDVARASGWIHEYAHLECARYRVATVFIVADPHELVPPPPAEAFS